MPSLPTPPALDHDQYALIVAHYPHAHGSLTLRGDGAGLDWLHGRPPDSVDGDTSFFRVETPPGECVETKLVRDDRDWMVGRNLVIAGGDRVEVRPSFTRPDGTLLAARSIDVRGYGPLRFRVMLPPSYDEQDQARFPVLYAQDGQALWSDGSDPFGVWNLDHIVDALWDLGAMQELIIVSIDTGERRLDRLGPVPDPEYGGGQAGAHLDAIVGTLKPLIDRELRTCVGPDTTSLLGSSMGGLFSFWAAWTRPDVFGSAICLSPSFWWADRWMIRMVREGVCPAPRPRLYLDSGAAATELEPDGSTRDGVHHTRTMFRALVRHCYQPEEELHVLTYVGAHHDAASWSARVAVPLQIEFPRAF